MNFAQFVCYGGGQEVQKALSAFIELVEEAKLYCLKLFHLMKGIDGLQKRYATGE